MRFPGLVAGVVLAASAWGQTQSVEGEYIEDRSNHVHGCYCEWSGEGVTGGKEATLGWRFTRGQYQGVNLDGVTIAVVIKGEGSLSMGKAPRRSVIVLDKAAGEEQRQASERLVRERYGTLIGEVIGTVALDIEFVRTADRAVLKATEFLNVEMRKAQLPEDALPGAIKWYDPFIPLNQYELGTTLNTAFKGTAFNHRWNVSEPGTRGYFGTFRFEISRGAT
jgi:hypothetical protein